MSDVQRLIYIGKVCHKKPCHMFKPHIHMQSLLAKTLAKATHHRQTVYLPCPPWVMQHRLHHLSLCASPKVAKWSTQFVCGLLLSPMLLPINFANVKEPLTIFSLAKCPCQKCQDEVTLTLVPWPIQQSIETIPVEPPCSRSQCMYNYFQHRCLIFGLRSQTHAFLLTARR